ncbi:glycosyltransferase [Acetobacter fallax]|uniref:Glycosyltransferase n=1 Tax=Acetobacter fallax TaxID=1737473 RepID=A0ABX0K7H5_9PROT|nr:glycosyltransferase family A protein [Acetobacter fallax]NHO31424.1 glycosyltransferase [Acetobacter fallax]NHO34992.1 glycosyltransferase [Acetobacter fallax]
MSSRFYRPLRVVAIPVRDEEDRIGLCLQGLAGQVGPGFDHVVLLLNNCTDGTRERAAGLASGLPFGLTIVEREYPAALAHAGTARREAMAIAAEIVGPDGVLFTTDADGVVAPDWLARTLDAFAGGAEAVCGRAVIDPVEGLAIPACLHEDDVAEVAYGTILDRIHDLADPDPVDPWPRHTEHSGASIAVTVEAWSRAGGIPGVPLGEDRGFIAALRRVDVAVRHAPGVVVTVSGRTEGRARGGMADTMARRMLRQDEMLDEALEPAMLCLRRARGRAWLRSLWGMPAPEVGDVRGLAALLELPVAMVKAQMEAEYSGRAWEVLEAASPALRREAVKRCDLDWHHAAADLIVRDLLRRDMMPVDTLCVADDVSVR